MSECENAFNEAWGFRADTRSLGERDWTFGWFKRGWDAAQNHQPSEPDHTNGSEA